MTQPRTLLDKLWDAHEILRRDDGASLLWVDRHLVHEGSHHAFAKIGQKQIRVKEPNLTFGVLDHYVPTNRIGIQIDPSIPRMMQTLRDNAAMHGFKLFDMTHQNPSQFALDTFTAATFRSAEYTVQITNSTDSDYHTLKISLFHDGSTVYLTQYASIFDNGAQAAFDADISSGNVRLLATPASSDTMAVKFIRTTIEV